MNVFMLSSDFNNILEIRSLRLDFSAPVFVLVY